MHLAIPVITDEIPHLRAHLAVIRERNGAGVLVLHGDFVREDEVEVLLCEGGGLDAAHGLEADFLAVDGGGGEVFLLDGAEGGFAALAHGGGEDGAAERGVDGGFVAGDVGVEALEGLVDGGLVADYAGGEEEAGAQLAREEALAVLELPADLLDGGGDELEVVFPQTFADIFAVREDASDVADVGEDLGPDQVVGLI
ncbi:hypothetical protein HBI81_016090 [Parastagonospora nodorum]|nr:hypothetical protein HBH50_189720 [Parastagonospora nodorum]KAH4452793.1 hypothetical protein HBH93_028650 [Parastagonospora nodorum]KAH4517997.1 hypothetical protein HBH89_007980 [Parastagonospora nodorum]KAH4861801.1 hypothetical protein HBH75_028780 [Parastagonospora nodorum]KAH5036754.1 hypothetical protein HBI74_055230 [Parastagonospora nodorum]